MMRTRDFSGSGACTRRDRADNRWIGALLGHISRPVAGTPGCAGVISPRLDEMGTRGCGVEAIGEILRFVGHQAFAEFHDAYRVGWNAVIGQYEFGDPEIAAADDALDREALLVWLDATALLDVVPAADSLARLRIIQHGIFAVDVMFDLEIARIRSI